MADDRGATEREYRVKLPTVGDAWEIEEGEQGNTEFNVVDDTLGKWAPGVLPGDKKVVAPGNLLIGSIIELRTRESGTILAEVEDPRVKKNRPDSPVIYARTLTPKEREELDMSRARFVITEDDLVPVFSKF